HVQDRRADRVVALIARPSVAGAGRDRVDHDQAEGQSELLLQRLLRLPRSTGAASYQRNGTRSAPPHFSRTTASRRSRTSPPPSAASSSPAHWRVTACPRKGCPAPSAAARSNTTKVFPAPHCPLSNPCPTAGIRFLKSHALSGRGSGSPCA